MHLNFFLPFQWKYKVKAILVSSAVQQFCICVKKAIIIKSRDFLDNLMKFNFYKTVKFKHPGSLLAARALGEKPKEDTGIKDPTPDLISSLEYSN